MKRLTILLAACLALTWSTYSRGSEPAEEGLHLQLEPLYIGVSGAREDLSDLVNHRAPMIVDPTNDFTLRGEISYRKGNLRVGFNGWWFDSDYELVKTVPPVSLLAQTKVSFWSVGPFVDYKIFGVEEKELFLQLGAKFSGSQQRLIGGLKFDHNFDRIRSHADIDFLGGPSIGLKGQINFLKNFRLQGFVTQTVSIGKVNRKVIWRYAFVEFTTSDTVFIPITEAHLKVSYYFTRNIGLGVGGFLSVWYAVPSPPRMETPFGAALRYWKEPESTLIFTGLILALEGKW
jgi:hypothetical protein